MPATGDETAVNLTLAEVKKLGAQRSSYQNYRRPTEASEIPEPKLATFRSEISPVLQAACFSCHGPEVQEGDFRVDTLDPDLLHGGDVQWWLEILDVLGNGEMPPPDDVELADDDRSKIIDWLSSEILVASQLRRSEKTHSSFRRMTRYEFNYAMQDLLGLPYDFAVDLPPETPTEDGFTNSSEVLQMSTMQLDYYRELGRKALIKATVRGDQPEPLYYAIAMGDAAIRLKPTYAEEIQKRKERFRDDAERLAAELERLAEKQSRIGNSPHYFERTTGSKLKASWRYNGAKYAWTPTRQRPDVPPVSTEVVVIPPQQKLIVELGNQVPDTGTMRVRVRASRSPNHNDRIPALRLEFGWQASNNSSASESLSDREISVDATSDEPQFYQWDIPVSEIKVRNPMRKTAKMGETPSPSEYLQLYNSTISSGDIHIDYVEIATPVYDHWPPASHSQVLIDSENEDDDATYAREVLSSFMRRAWRREVSVAEVDQKVELFNRLRPSCDDFQEAMIEVLATIVSSPKFLYLGSVSGDENRDDSDVTDDYQLATRLSMFLWCSVPDEQLLKLAAKGTLHHSDVLLQQTNRMLADARSDRFSHYFVRGWLGMQLLDYLNVDKKTYPKFNVSLKQSMQQEPVEFFREVLRNNHSVMDFLHADYAVVNEPLARHYGYGGVYGNQFRRVALESDQARGGLLTQAGLLAMNSDGKDSHPLKRGIWLLKSLLNDPPPPPPPAVPEIDLADPEIAKMTLKQRIENHRDDPACLSCHAKIDPWGIAFENYDAVGAWRTMVNGAPVDASSALFNHQELNGVDGLKRFLLSNRQDQFARALVYKMVTFALGRPISFADRANIDEITARLRNEGDGLHTLITLIVTSDLFQSS